MIETLITGILSAVVAYVVPKALDNVFKGQKVSAKFPWGYWVIAHAAGGAVGGALSAGLGLSGLNTPGGFGNWAVFGASLGIAQWLVLQQYLRIGPAWAVWSAAGWATFSFFAYFKLPGFIGWTAVGILVGILQWLSLRAVSHKAGWWIPANGIAWVAGFHIALPITLAARLPPGVNWIFGWGLLAVLGSVITGLAMTRIQKRGGV